MLYIVTEINKIADYRETQETNFESILYISLQNLKKSSPSLPIFGNAHLLPFNLQTSPTIITLLPSCF